MAAPKPERFRAADVCQLAQVQPYELRSWETEFADLGQSTAGGARTYSRADVERVLQIRELVKGEGLTLSGARRRLEEAAGDGTAMEFSLVDAATRTRLRSIRDGLVALLAVLDKPLDPGGFQLVAAPAATGAGEAVKPARRGKR